MHSPRSELILVLHDHHHGLVQRSLLVDLSRNLQLTRPNRQNEHWMRSLSLVQPLIRPLSRSGGRLKTSKTHSLQSGPPWLPQFDSLTSER